MQKLVPKASPTVSPGHIRNNTLILPHGLPHGTMTGATEFREMCQALYVDILERAAHLNKERTSLRIPPFDPPPKPLRPPRPPDARRMVQDSNQDQGHHRHSNAPPERTLKRIWDAAAKNGNLQGACESRPSFHTHFRNFSRTEAAMSGMRDSTFVAAATPQ